MPVAIPAALGLGALGAGAAGVIAPATAAIVGAGALSAASSVYGANKAASAQNKAAQTASNTQQGMFDQTQANLAPFIQSGQDAQNKLTAQLPSLTAPITMDEATLQNTPGYQFNQYWGQKGVANSAAARGLGTSGAALQGAARFATGLADSTYQNQFQNAVTNQSNTYNRLLSAAGLGENAAAGLGNNAVATGGNIGSNITSAGNAAGASIIAGTNGVNNGLNSIPNSFLTSQYLDNQSKTLDNGLYANNNVDFNQQPSTYNTAW